MAVLAFMAQASMAYVILNKTNVTMKVGEFVYITASSSMGGQIAWNSFEAEKNGVVSLYGGGLYEGTTYRMSVKALKEGTTTLKATATGDDWSSASCTITVKGYLDGYTFEDKSNEGVFINYMVVDVSAKTCMVKKVYSSYKGKCTIPSYANGLKVIAIGDSAFQDSQLSSVVLPSTVQTIGKYAFGNSNIEEVSFAEGLQFIGDDAFWGCSNLTSVKYPSTLMKIGDRAFAGTKILSVSGVNQLEYVGANAFEGTPLIERMPTGEMIFIGKVLYLYKRREYTGNDAQLNDWVTMTLEIPEGTTMISGNAFGKGIYGQDSISLVIPASCTYIQCDDGWSDPKYRLYGLRCLPHSIKVAPGNPVYDSRNGCNALMHTATNTLLAASRLTSFIPENTKAIGNGALYYYGVRSEIKSIVVPASVESIGDMAFESAFVDSIIIGKGVKSIGNKLVVDCWNLKYIAVDDANVIYDSRDNCNAIIERSTNKLLAGCKNTVIPATVKTIGSYAFGWNTRKTLIVPDGVETIEDYAFGNSSGLKVLILGKGVKTIGRALLGTHPNSEQSLCVLSNIPPSVITDNDGGWDYPSLSTSMTENVTLYVPQGSMARYMMADGWNQFKTIKEGMPDIPVDEVIINENGKNHVLQTGETLQLTATVLPENATNKRVTWKSSNESAIIVNESGLVTCVTKEFWGGDGQPCGVWCYSEESKDIYDFISLSAKAIHPIRISLPATALVARGGTLQLIPEITPENATVTLTWSSDDESIATVDNNGVVKGIKIGQTFINVKGNGLSATCKLTVTATEPVSITIPESVSIELGGTIILTPTFTPTDAVSELTWKSDNENVAKVDANGVLTGLSEGLALVTATAANGIVSNQCKVTVSRVVTTMVVRTSTAGYATFYDSSSAYTLPAGLEAQTVTELSGGKLNYQTLTDGVVPKSTAVMLSSGRQQSENFTLTKTENSTNYTGTNLLHGSDEATTTTGDGYHYKLTYGPSSDSKLKDVFGWYWGASNGGSFWMDGHKAWLVLPKSAGARSFAVNGEANGLLGIDSGDSDSDHVVYDLQGRRVNNSQAGKGLYIQNGKKVIK